MKCRRYILYENFNDNLHTIWNNFNASGCDYLECDNGPLWWPSRKPMGKRPSNDSRMSSQGTQVIATWFTSTFLRAPYSYRLMLYIVWEAEDEREPVKLASKEVLHAHRNDWIRPLMYIFTSRRIQMTQVSNWLHGKLEICGNMRPLLKTWQLSSLAQNTTARQLIEGLWWWSSHVWSLYLSSMWCL